MFIFGLALSLAYIPGITGNVLPTGWAFLSILLPLTLWIKADLTPFHWLGAVFLAYAALSILWTPEPWDGLYTLWHLGILALAFRLGSTNVNLTPLWKGLAVGLSASSLVSVIQLLGYNPVAHATPYPGLYFNGVAHGTALAIVIVALLSNRLWLWVPCLVPGLLLSGSRAAWIATLLGALFIFHRRAALAILPLLVFALTTSIGPSDIQRFAIWSAAFHHLTLWGNGAGSFLSILLLGPYGLQHPEFAHNDYLQFAFEFGLGALPLLFGIWLYAQPQHPLFPVTAAFLLLALVAMPFHIPVVVCAFAVASGRLARDWHRARDVSNNLRPFLLYQSATSRQALSPKLGLPQSELTP